MAEKAPETSSTASSAAAASSSSELESTAETKIFDSRWNVIETGEHDSRGMGRKRDKTSTRTFVCSFANMLEFARWFSHYPLPSAFFRASNECRITRRKNQPLNTMVTGLMVVRAHIAGQYSDPHFKSEELGAGSVLMISNITSAAALDSLWKALIFRIVGGTMYPDGSIGCIRAKDETTRDTSAEPSYRVELWLRPSKDITEESTKTHMRGFVKEFCTDEEAAQKITLKYRSMAEDSYSSSSNSGGSSASRW